VSFVATKEIETQMEYKPARRFPETTDYGCNESEWRIRYDNVESGCVGFQAIVDLDDISHFYQALFALGTFLYRMPGHIVAKSIYSFDYVPVSSARFQP